MSNYYNTFKRDRAAGKPAEQPFIDPEFIGLLCKLTDAYNKKVSDNYDDGYLDFIPKDIPPHRMLQTILTSYALDRFPDALNEMYHNN